MSVRLRKGVRGGARRAVWALVAVALLMGAVCVFRSWRRHRTRHAPPDGKTLVTGYCNCGKCCGWKRNWFGFGVPIYNYGPMKGKRKQVGVTATGATAKHGTIAANPKVFKFGTRLDIPGYGTGVVEDVGGSIKGRHLDVWFPSHDAARKWGARKLDVRVVK